jgi:beta-1,4-mannosyltransferase
MTVWHLPEDGVVRNPYGQLLVSSLEARGVRVVSLGYRHLFALRALDGLPDAIHFQFIDVFVVPAGQVPALWRAWLKGPLFLLQICLLRLAGCRIVWTVHNLGNHERRLAWVEWFFSLMFARLAHALVVHGEAAREAVMRAYRLRRDRITVVFHPNYDGAYPDHLTRDEARRRLGIEPATVVVLSLGPMRPYKGLPDAVRAFRSMEHRGPAVYWIAGATPDAGVLAELRHDADATAGVILRPGHVAPADVETLLKACDVVALPYRRILTSGAAVLAMTYGRPCVAPRLGCLPEVLDDRGAFLYDPAIPGGLRDALTRAVSSPALLSMGQHNRACASDWTWARAADILIALYSGRPPAAAAGVQ